MFVHDRFISRFAQGERAQNTRRHIMRSSAHLLLMQCRSPQVASGASVGPWFRDFKTMFIDRDQRVRYHALRTVYPLWGDNPLDPCTSKGCMDTHDVRQFCIYVPSEEVHKHAHKAFRRQVHEDLVASPVFVMTASASAEVSRDGTLYAVVYIRTYASMRDSARGVSLRREVGRVGESKASALVLGEEDLLRSVCSTLRESNSMKACIL